MNNSQVNTEIITNLQSLLPPYSPFLFSHKSLTKLFGFSLLTCQLRSDALLILHRSPGTYIFYSFTGRTLSNLGVTWQP